MKSRHHLEKALKIAYSLRGGKQKDLVEALSKYLTLTKDNYRPAQVRKFKAAAVESNHK